MKGVIAMVKINKDCVLCGACIEICSMMALELKKNKILCNSNCVDCKMCINVCPFLAISLKKGY